MPPKHKAARGHAAAKPPGKKDGAEGAEPAAGAAAAGAAAAAAASKEITADDVTDRACTGECAMAPGAKDIKFVNFSLSFHGERLIEVRSCMGVCV